MATSLANDLAAASTALAEAGADADAFSDAVDALQAALDEHDMWARKVLSSSATTSSSAPPSLAASAENEIDAARAPLLAESLLAGGLAARALRAALPAGKEGAKARRTLFAVLRALVRALDAARLAPHAAELLECCRYHARMEGTATDREAALVVLSDVLRRVADGDLPLSLVPDVPDLALALQRALQRSSKGSKSAGSAEGKATGEQGSMLSTLGQLLRVAAANAAAAGRDPVEAAA